MQFHHKPSKERFWSTKRKLESWPNLYEKWGLRVHIHLYFPLTFYHVSNGKAQKAIFRTFYFQVSHLSWHGAWNLCNFSWCLWSKVLSRGWLPAHSSLPSQQSQMPSLTRPLGIHEGELLLKRTFFSDDFPKDKTFSFPLFEVRTKRAVLGLVLLIKKRMRLIDPDLKLCTKSYVYLEDPWTSLL